MCIRDRLKGASSFSWKSPTEASALRLSQPPTMENERPTRLSHALLAGALVVAVIGAVWRAPAADWNLSLFAILLGFSVFSDVTAIETESRLKISGSFLALVLAMVLLGGTPAALIGVAGIFAGWLLRFREPLHDLLINLLTYVTFPLVVGVAFRETIAQSQISSAEPAFYVPVSYTH